MSVTPSGSRTLLDFDVVSVESVASNGVVVAADVTGDGRTDFVLPDASTSVVALVGPDFSERAELASRLAVRDLKAVDLDHNGWTDVLVCDSGGVYAVMNRKCNECFRGRMCQTVSAAVPPEYSCVGLVSE
jgi:hypothetical protein